jgi:hypothetical protein
MKNRLRSKVAIWLRSWRTTFRELKHFVERHFKFVLAALAITYSLIWGGMYLIVVPTPSTDQAKQQSTSGNGNGKANAPGQLKKGK